MRTGISYDETYNQIRDEISKVLESIGCDYKIVELNKSKVILSDGVVLIGKMRKYFLSLRFEHNKLYRYMWWFKESTSEQERNADKERYRLEGCRRGGYSAQKMYGDEIKKNLNNGVPWNKGKTGVQVVWNKGLTKETSESIRVAFSEGRMGDKNPAYGKAYPESAKKKQSDTIKAKILSGEFTPNVKNSRTNWECLCDGIKFRSSWEAAFWYVNQHTEYEKIRLPYVDENQKLRVYITDFSFQNLIYEIGPSCKVQNKLFKKIGANVAGYELKFICEKEIFEIVKNFTDEDFEHFNSETVNKLKKFLNHENRKKNKN